MVKRIVFVLTLFFLIIIRRDWAIATQVGDYDFSEIEEFIEEEDELNDISFSYIFKMLLKGDVNKILSYISEFVINRINSGSNFSISIFKNLVFIILASTLLTCFTNMLDSNQVKNTGFYAIYLLLIGNLLISFLNIFNIAEGIIEKTTRFMELLIPVYIVSVGVSDGGAVAYSYYQIVIIIFTLIEIICLKIFLPAVGVYAVLHITGNVSEHIFTLKLCELIELIVKYGLKILLGVIIGLNIIQKMITPVQNQFVLGVTGNIIGAFGGGGSNVKAISEIVIGSGKIIKNSIGLTGIILFFFLLCVPVIEILIYIFGYKIIEGISYPVADERISNCLAGMIKAGNMLLNTVFTVSIIFVITITIVCIN